ncbi:MAG: hypothetical protein IJR49_05540, partial [Treponema sp.]|nr:hypothetical protein [Treponema sp.]
NFRTIEENHLDIFLNDKRHTVLYNINAFAKLQQSEKRALLEYIALGKKNTHFADRLESRVLAVKNNDDWRIDKMTYEMKILEERRDAWQQSREIALAEGREEGFERGISQGFEQGIERGANNRSIEIASRMLDMNIDAHTVSLATGIPEEEIEGLRNV